MRSVSGLATVALLLLAWPTRGQEVPELTKARLKVVTELLDACRKAGAFTVEGKGARAIVRFDEKKVGAVVAERRAQVTPELVDALLAAWFRVDARFQPVVMSLLRACGEEKKDERALGLAAFLAARMDLGALRQGEALRGFQQAARHFARAKETAWQAASLNNVGSVLKAQGEYEEALKHFRQALAMDQALYPKDKFKHGHPLLALSLNNVGSVLQDQGEYEEALKHYRQALAMRQALYPKDKFKRGHPLLASSLTNVGGGLQARGEHEEALKHFRLALAMQQALYPKDKYKHGHPDLALSLNHVGSVL
jgi:tetratricopeptide (TPR) repeat protein